MLTDLRRGLLLLVVFTVITGLLYPLVVTGLAQMTFPDEARGSLVERGGKAVGS